MSKKNKIILIELLILVTIACNNVQIIVGFLWIIVHELMHILLAYFYNAKIVGIKIKPFGAVAEFKDIYELNDDQRIKIYLVGPLINLSLGIIFFVLNRYIENKFIESSAYVNISLFIFNMLPAYPLDGSRIYEILLNKKIIYKKAKNILIKTSYLLSIVLLVLFIITIYIHRVNLSLLISSILIIYTSYMEKKSIIYIMMDNICRKRRKLASNNYLENKNLSIYYKANIATAMGLFDNNKYNVFFVIGEDFRVLSVIHEDEIINALKKYGNISFDEYLVIKKDSS